MKRLITLATALLIASFSAFGQDIKQDGATIQEDTIYSYVERMPEPAVDIKEFLKKNVRYPADAREAGIEGKVYVRFFINSNGKMCDPVIFRPLYPSLDKEALRMVSSMPLWKPGSSNGKNVPVHYMVPVHFILK